MEPETFFISPKNTAQRRYEALRAYYVEKLSAAETARRFGYTLSAFYSLTRDFRTLLETEEPQAEFFKEKKAGRKPKDSTGEICDLIIALRKKYLSVPDIKAVLDVHGHEVSEKYIYNVIEKDGFARLPRRDGVTRKGAASEVKMEAPRAERLAVEPETCLFAI